jgi:hypothetical protein
VGADGDEELPVSQASEEEDDDPATISGFYWYAAVANLLDPAKPRWGHDEWWFLFTNGVMVI